MKSGYDPENYRILSTLDTLKVRTKDGLIPLSNFITKSPVKKLGEINRIDQKRFFDIKAGVADGLTTTLIDQNGNKTEVFINANERIAHLTKYLEKIHLDQELAGSGLEIRKTKPKARHFFRLLFQQLWHLCLLYY